MQLVTAAGAGFLLAVLWFDLMFDVQTRRQAGPALPEEVLASISTYYGRVTTGAVPMNRLVAIAMLATLVSIVWTIVEGSRPAWIGWTSLVFAAAAIAPAIVRTVPNAKRLGESIDPIEKRSGLARAIYRDHVSSFACMCVVLGFQFIPD